MTPEHVTMIAILAFSCGVATTLLIAATIGAAQAVRREIESAHGNHDD